MKFKNISGDFVAEYNRTMEQYKSEQADLDKKYDSKINELLLREKSRLRESFPDPFEIGSLVKDEKGNIGKVLKCPVDIEVCFYDEYDCSPKRYLPLKGSDCEDIVTCEGNVKRVVVEFNSSEIEKDWGHDTRIRELWADEVEEA